MRMKIGEQYAHRIDIYSNDRCNKCDTSTDPSMCAWPGWICASTQQHRTGYRPKAIADERQQNRVSTVESNRIEVVAGQTCARCDSNLALVRFKPVQKTENKNVMECNTPSTVAEFIRSERN